MTMKNVRERVLGGTAAGTWSIARKEIRDALAIR
jgi:hypothetical protein